MLADLNAWTNEASFKVLDLQANKQNANRPRSTRRRQNRQISPDCLLPQRADSLSVPHPSPQQARTDERLNTQALPRYLIGSTSACRSVFHRHSDKYRSGCAKGTLQPDKL
jgi:hypothetical protein